jgi:acetyl-CoA acyltransferase
MADAYALACQRKADEAIKADKMKEMVIPIEVELADGTKILAEKDQQPRPETSIEGLANLKTPFRENGRVTAGNASGLNDGAAAVLLLSMEKADELKLEPKMRWVASGVASVDPRIMGTAPVPATQKALGKAGLAIADIDIIELNEAFAVQALYCLDRWGLEADDPKVNPWGGAIAYGHPLAASGPRLVAFLAGQFKKNPRARYGLTTMCVGRGQGYSIIWENLTR